jgi:hypothetical protein
MAALERLFEVTSESSSCEVFLFPVAAFVGDCESVFTGIALLDVADECDGRGCLTLISSSFSVTSISAAFRLPLTLEDAFVLGFVVAEEYVLSSALETDFDFLPFGTDSLV